MVVDIRFIWQKNFFSVGCILIFSVNYKYVFPSYLIKIVNQTKKKLLGPPNLALYGINHLHYALLSPLNVHV